MVPRSPVLLAALTVAGVATACLRAHVEPPCDVENTTITDSSIGPLVLAEAVPTLARRCAALRDTNVVGTVPGRTDTLSVKTLLVSGAPVLVYHDKVRVVALRALSPVLRTLDGIGAGVSVARFRERPGIQVSMPSDSSPPILRDRARCGMLFDLSAWGPNRPATENDPPLTGADLAAWPDSIVVTRVTVNGCRVRSQSPALDSVFDAQQDSMDAAGPISRSPSDTARDSTMIAPPSVAPPSVAPPSVAPPSVAPETTSAPSNGGGSATVAATLGELAALERLLIVPVQGVARSALRDTYTEPRTGHVHGALDILAPRGTPVLSAADGKVLRLFTSKPGGLMVYASDPSERFILLYGHLDHYASGIRQGMPLRQGQVIGYVGTTGDAPANTPHLHFGILRGRPTVQWWKGTPVNPYPLLAK